VATALIQEFKIEDRSTANYDAISSRLEGIEADGLIVHSAGFDDDAGVFRIFDVWESEQQARKFIDEHVNPLVAEMLSSQPDAAPPSRDDFYELHHVVTGAEVHAHS
jgi:hypothetical protein